MNINFSSKDAVIMDSLPVPTIILGLEESESIIYVNPAFSDLTGFSLEECLEMNPWELIPHPEDRIRLRERETSFLAKKLPGDRVDFQILTKSGKHIWVDMKAGLSELDSHQIIILSLYDVSARRILEKKLFNTQTSLEKARDAVYWISRKGEIQYVNEAACTMLNYTREKLLSMTVFDLDPDFHREIWDRHWNNTKKRRSYVIETRHKPSDGEPIPVEISITFMELDGQEYHICFARDVSERNRVLEALRQSEARYKLLTESIPVGVFQVNAEGAPVFFNSRMKEITGFEKDEIYQGRWHDVIHPDDFETVSWDRKKALAEKGFYIGEYRLIHKQGRVIWVLGQMVSIIDSRGNLSGYLGTITDITRQKELEVQFFQAQKMEAVGHLAGGIAHDFNNLLTVINGYSEHLLDDLSGGDPTHEMISQIYNAGLRAEGLTRQLLAFSRKQVLQPEPTNLNNLIKEMEKMLSRIIGEDIRLETEFSPDINIVKADRSQLSQVILNLVVNARDAMPSGGRLYLTTANTVLDQEFCREKANLLPGKYVKLSIRDEGSGIPEEIIDKIFEPFFTTKDFGKGTGLGLSTVYGIVNQSGGYVDVESRPGKGSQFNIYLRSENRKVDPGWETERNLGDLKGNEKVLVVEDEDSVRNLTAMTLEKNGYKVLTALSGEEAVEILRKEGDSVDILLTDLVMPGMQGSELLEHVSRYYPGIRRLCMSGYSEDKMLQQNIADKRMLYLQKPFSGIQLLEVLRRAVNS